MIAVAWNFSHSKVFMKDELVLFVPGNKYVTWAAATTRCVTSIFYWLWRWLILRLYILYV